MILGTGILTWFREERIGDRYGLVYLAIPGSGPRNPSGGLDDAGSVILMQWFAGCTGTLTAVVLETRPSGHIGDVFRGIFPSTPNVGDRIVLGTGTLFFGEEEERGKTYHKVGLLPDDGRKTDWLDPEALYRCHEQTVRLEFTETPHA